MTKLLETNEKTKLNYALACSYLIGSLELSVRMNSSMSLDEIKYTLDVAKSYLQESEVLNG